MIVLLNLAVGVLFGAGLVVSGMTDPAKVLNFLDIAGSFDPSLAFVMGGAVLIGFLGYRLVLARGKPIMAARFELPERTRIDASLVAGAVVFGVGWGLVGFCPGPAFAALSTGVPGAFVFVAAMLAGMAIGRWLTGQRAVVGPPAAAAIKP